MNNTITVYNGGWDVSKLTVLKSMFDWAAIERNKVIDDILSENEKDTEDEHT